MRRQAALWLLLATGTALGLIALMRPELLAGGRGTSVLYLSLLLAYVGSSVWTGARADMGAALHQAVIWLAVIVALAAGWRLWHLWT